MKRILSIATFSILLVSLIGCGDDGNSQSKMDAAPADAPSGTPDAGVDAAPDVDGGAAGAPALGTQIDRAGRPAISTALIETFNTENGGADATTAKQGYNGDGDVSNWVTKYADTIKASWAIYDALDTTTAGGGNDGCAGNALANFGDGDYDTISAALADDRLIIDSGQAACANGYLGIEAEVIVGGGAATGCGGRKPTDDVIDISYSALATGNPAAGVTDGIDGDDGTAAVDDVFPFLGDAN